MNDSSPDPRYAIGDRPVNRRTVRPELTEFDPATPDVVLQRARQVHSRYQLGAPLSELLLAPSTVPHRAPVPVQSIAMVLVGTSLWPLLNLVNTLPAQGALAMAALGLYAQAWRRARRSRQEGAQQQGARLGAGVTWALEPNSLQLLDGVLETVSPDLSEALLAQLLALKSSLVRVVALARSPIQGEFHRMENRLYLQECVRRYLPDSLLAYLRIPADHRDAVMEGAGISAAQALAAQLTLIQNELDRQEALGVAGAGQSLLQQQQFLQAKARREH